MVPMKNMAQQMRQHQIYLLYGHCHITLKLLDNLETIICHQQRLNIQELQNVGTYIPLPSGFIEENLRSVGIQRYTSKLF